MCSMKISINKGLAQMYTGRNTLISGTRVLRDLRSETMKCFENESAPVATTTHVEFSL